MTVCLQWTLCWSHDTGMGNRHLQVITGLIGVRPGVSGDQIVVNPITLPGVKYFCLDGLKYRGHWVTVLWDLDGSKYVRTTRCPDDRMAL